MLTRMLFLLCLMACLFPCQAADRPNILLAISDDQSWVHVGAGGDPVVSTPAFDRVAREGVLFTNAYCAAPTCGPSRSALLTGQAIWRLEEAGNIHSTLPAKFATYTQMLQSAGYHVGYTSKGWSPGRLAPGGRTQNPAGQRYASFAAFLKSVPSGTPFCFWQGSFDPHRPYKLGAGAASGMDASKVIVPPHLPDNDLVRNDILDYYTEVQRFDSLVATDLQLLEKAGILDDTLVVVTSDHGMPFPRAKASLYDYGARVPLAIRWPDRVPAGRTLTDFVGLADLAPTFLEVGGLSVPDEMTGRSLMGVLASKKSGRVDSSRDAAFIAMERHDGCRAGGKGYPCRAIRTDDYLYIYNFEPARWPSGSPDRTVCARNIPYGEIDTSPTKNYMMHASTGSGTRLAALSFGMRPAEELYVAGTDPGQLDNVAPRVEMQEVRRKLHERLMNRLKQTNDPRALGKPAPWDFYAYYGRKINQNWSVEAKPTEEDNALSLLVQTLNETENIAVRKALMRGMLSGLAGRRNISAPALWSQLSLKLAESDDATIRDLSQQLSQIFGDKKATARALATVQDKSAKVSSRRSALRSLLMQRNEDVSDVLESLLDEPELALDAIRGYATVENATAPALLLARYEQSSPELRRAVIETLATRKRYAEALLRAVKQKTVVRDEIPAHVARSLNLILGKRFVDVFGKVRQLATDRMKLMAKYKKMLTPRALANADAARGRAVFKKTCANCHVLYDEGGKIGPNLTGSNRANLDYILLNSVDPSYDVPDGYKMVLIQTFDGRVLNGVVAEEDATRLVLKTVDQPRVIIAKEDIETRRVSPKSMMPDGQLEKMKRQEVIDLIKYLRTTEQVEIAK